MDPNIRMKYLQGQNPQEFHSSNQPQLETQKQVQYLTDVITQMQYGQNQQIKPQQNDEFKNKFLQNEQKVKVLENQIGNLNKQIQDSSHKFNILEKTIHPQEKVIVNAVNYTLDPDLLEQLRFLQDSNNKYQRNIQKQDQHIENLNYQIKQLYEENILLRQQQQQVSQNQQSEEQWRSRCKSLEDQLAKLQQQSMYHSQQQSQIQQTLKASTTQDNSSIRQLQQQIQELEQQINLYEIEIQALKQNFNTEENEFKRLQFEYDRLRMELSRQSTKPPQLQLVHDNSDMMMIEQLKQQIQLLEDENRKYYSIYNDAVSLQKEVTQLKIENNEYSRSIQSYQSQLKTAVEQQDWKVKSTQLESVIFGLEGNLSQSNKSALGSQEEILRLKSYSDQMENNYKNEQYKLQQFERDNVSFKSSINQYQTQITQYNQDSQARYLQDSQQRERDLQQKLQSEQINVQMTEYQVKLQQQLSQIVFLNQEITGLKEQGYQKSSQDENQIQKLKDEVSFTNSQQQRELLAWQEKFTQQSFQAMQADKDKSLSLQQIDNLNTSLMISRQETVESVRQCNHFKQIQIQNEFQIKELSTKINQLEQENVRNIEVWKDKNVRNVEMWQDKQTLVQIENVRNIEMLQDKNVRNIEMWQEKQNLIQMETSKKVFLSEKEYQIQIEELKDSLFRARSECTELTTQVYGGQQKDQQKNEELNRQLSEWQWICSQRDQEIKLLHSFQGDYQKQLLNRPIPIDEFKSEIKLLHSFSGDYQKQSLNRPIPIDEFKSRVYIEEKIQKIDRYTPIEENQHSSALYFQRYSIETPQNK